MMVIGGWEPWTCVWMLVCVSIVGAAAAPGPLPAQVLMTRDEALRTAFPPPATVERRTVFLSKDDRKLAEKIAGSGVHIRNSVVTYYVGREGGRVLGIAYFDVHRVRTLNEVVMMVVTPEATISRMEVLRFSEPPEYKARRKWLGLFKNRGLEDGIELKGPIPNMTGATLTSRAIKRSARRVLALHKVIDPVHREEGRN